MGSVFLVLMLVLALMLFPAFGNVIQLIVAMLIWMMVGNVAGHIIRGESYGVAGNVALGLAGGIIGTFLMRVLGLRWFMAIPVLGYIITGVFGAVFLVLLMRLTIDRNFGK